MSSRHAVLAVTAMILLATVLVLWLGGDSEEDRRAQTPQPETTAKQPRPPVPHSSDVAQADVTRIVKRADSRRSFVVENGVFRHIASGGAYVCIAGRMPVQFNVEDEEWEALTESEGPDATCPVGAPIELNPETVPDGFLLRERDREHADRVLRDWQIINGRRAPVMPPDGPTFACLAENYLVWDYVNEAAIKRFPLHGSLTAARCQQ